MLSAVQEDDHRFLYQLLKERPKYANISHRQMPTWKEHRAFVRSKPYVAWFVLWANDERIGSMYLTRGNEVGIFILRKYWGRGYAALAVRNIPHRGRLLAHVSPKNKRSIAFFKRLGFKHIQNTYERA